MQDHAEKAAVHRECAAVVIDKAKFSELVHEMADTRACCTDHLSEVFLVNAGEYRFCPAFLAEMSEQQKNTGQSLLARVEELIHQVLFVPDVARKQVGEEKFREIMLFMEHAGHQRLIDPYKAAIGDGRGRSNAQWLSGEASFAEKVAAIENGYDRLFALPGGYRNSDLASPDVKDRIRPVSLSEDTAVSPVFEVQRLAAGDFSQKRFPISSPAFLVCHNQARR